MKFREINYREDVDEIINLLNANFETNHTKEAFLWKHFDNPFGQSYGLLAVDNRKIVALRMFMRWEFYCNNKIIKAIRPVDTCTDHDYRGKGLFKKITLQGLENIKDEYDLIFNTPNDNSKPGYLKMGWKEIHGKFNYKIGVLNLFKKTQDYKNILPGEIEFQKDWQQEKTCSTSITDEYLKWRYSDSDYKIASFEEKGIVVYKIIHLKGFKTLVLIDAFGDKTFFDRWLVSLCKKNNAKAVYFLDNSKNKNLKFLFTLNRNNQTVVSKDDQHHINEKISFSLGDLEGRL